MNDNKQNIPTFAIILPVYNEEQNIRQSLESICAQTFTDWVCYIMNDCSTDRTGDICLEFVDKDPRFKYIESKFKHYDKNDESTIKDKDMSGISNMINLGLVVSLSKYIIRHDGDDEMLPNRLQITYDWMEAHPDVDIAGFPLICTIPSIKGIYNLSGGNGDGKKDMFIDKYEMLKQNYKPYHPTLCIRRDITFSKINFAYRQIFDGCEDTAFYYHCLSHECKIMLADTPPVEVYKNAKAHKTQTMIHNRLFEVYNNYENKHYNPDNEFTVILTFKNEGMEVEKTIISLLFNDQNINIILIDDGSTDDFNYKELADIFGCFYYKNKVSLGCAGARDVGVKFVNTPYFMLMDAHMRFPISDRDFSKRFINKLKKDENQIVFCNTNIMGSDTDEDAMFRHYTNEDCIATPNGSAAIGAKYNMEHKGNDWSSDWCYNILDDNDHKLNNNKTDTELCVETVSIMGATYATSVNWWNKIGGLKGLYMWGHDEPLMSLKTYLLGGKCVCFKNYAIGHLYRTKPVYGALDTTVVATNILFIQYLMSHDKNHNKEVEDKMFQEYLSYMQQRYKDDSFIFNKVFENFNSHKPEYDEIKNWLWSNNVRELEDVYKLQERLI